MKKKTLNYGHRANVQLARQYFIIENKLRRSLAHIMFGPKPNPYNRSATVGFGEKIERFRSALIMEEIFGSSLKNMISVLGSNLKITVDSNMKFTIHGVHQLSDVKKNIEESYFYKRVGNVVLFNFVECGGHQNFGVITVTFPVTSGIFPYTLKRKPRCSSGTSTRGIEIAPVPVFYPVDETTRNSVLLHIRDVIPAEAIDFLLNRPGFGWAELFVVSPPKTEIKISEAHYIMPNPTHPAVEESTTTVVEEPKTTRPEPSESTLDLDVILSSIKELNESKAKIIDNAMKMISERQKKVAELNTMVSTLESEIKKLSETLEQIDK
jgi:hypothetical protein